MISISSNLNIMIKAAEKASKYVIRDFGEVEKLQVSKKEIISGLIYDPIKDEMYYAERNKGAFLNNQRLRVSKKKHLR